MRDVDVRGGYWLHLLNRSIASKSAIRELFFLCRVLLEVVTWREMVTTFLLVVTTSHVLRELNLLHHINVLGKASFAVAVRACVPGADTFVWF